MLKLGNPYVWINEMLSFHFKIMLFFKGMLPVLKYVRGEHLSQDHWLDMFRLLGLPRGATLEKLAFSDILSVANTIVEKALELKVCLYIGRLGVLMKNTVHFF